MAYAFQGISTMSSALRAFQTQLDVTGDNIANSETTGYNRRTVTLRQAPATSETIGATVSVGNGVNVQAVSRVRDLFLATRRTEAESKLSRQQESLTGVTNIQSSLNEPGDNGISAAYDAFNNAWTTLSASPSEASAKGDVQAAANSLVSRINGLAQSLQSQKSDNATNTTEILGKIDAATSKIASLNASIAKATAEGGTPNDLLDARDQTVQELAGYADVTVSKGDGNVTVSLNGFNLVTPSGSTTISDKYDASSGKIVVGPDTYPVNGGTLAGAHDTDAAIDATSARLDAFADNLRTGVNALYATGKTSDGTSGASFFADPVPPATSVGGLGLSLATGVANDANSITPGTSGLAGDGTLATQIAALGDTKVTGLGNQSMNGYYAAMVSNVGTQVASATDAVSTQTAVVKQIDTQISSTSGVSMDDEMANLLRYQRAYQAAAKALTTFDSMSETIINMLER